MGVHNLLTPVLLRAGRAEPSTADILHAVIDHLGKVAWLLKPEPLPHWRSEMDAAVACVRDQDAPVAVLQCTTAYPCPPEKTGLNVIAELSERYQCPTGLSDHSGRIYAGLSAVTLGAWSAARQA